MNIALIDPFYDTSHQYWAEGLIQNSRHQIEVFSCAPKHWKWQMIGGTFELAQRMKQRAEEFDLFLVTDMLDLPCFLGYLKDFKVPPIALYFHENQITYPWSNSDQDVKEKRDYHYGFMNLRSALVADKIIFNSMYHQFSLLESLPSFIKMFPSIKPPFALNELKKKAMVLPIGMNMIESKRDRSEDEKPIFIWNHRWEYDKNPKQFFEVLFTLKDMDIDFQLIVLGKEYATSPPIFQKAKEVLKNEIINWGYVKSRTEYNEKLQLSNLTFVTSHQDFFGISVVEAILAGNFPLLPNRLAYPEHIIDHSSTSIYDEDNIMEKLLQIIDNQLYRGSIEESKYVEKYLWRNVIQDYDDLFESMI